MKTFKEFVNEELSPYKYRMAADRLNPKLHKNRRKNLIDHYINQVKGFGPVDIVKIVGDQYILYENCKIEDVIDENNDQISLVFMSENGKEIIWKIFGFYNEHSLIKTYVHDKDLVFTNRGDAVKFLNLVKSILKDKDKDGLIHQQNIDDYYISDKNIEYSLGDVRFIPDKNNKSRSWRLTRYFS